MSWWVTEVTVPVNKQQDNALISILDCQYLLIDEWSMMCEEKMNYFNVAENPQITKCDNRL